MIAIEYKRPSRIVSIDIMRGLILLLMLFVNDLYEPGVPHWLVHAKATEDGMGLADWVFPGFLFMVGMAIPYAIASRRKQGDTPVRIAGHILLRSASLLLIGLFMMNGEEHYNAAATGMPRLLWLILGYISIILVWNYYPENSRYKGLFSGLKALGIMGLITLAAIFRSVHDGEIGWMHTGWWGILGLIGWGYLVAALCYLFIGDQLLPVILVWVFFILLNIFSHSGKLYFLHALQPVLGVIIGANVPSIVLSGMVLSLLLRKKATGNSYKLCFLILILGIIYMFIGVVLYKWFIISKTQGTPSWAMICNGISMITFAVLYLIVDVYHKKRWAYMFKESGNNSLTTYLVPDIVYFITWALHVPVFFYKQDSNVFLAISGSLAWAIVMIVMVIFLSKVPVRLKL